MSDALLVPICAVLGLIAGSFVNVVVERVPQKESVVLPPSHCRSCGAAIEPRDNIPVVSWFLLGGQCRNCGVCSAQPTL